MQNIHISPTLKKYILQEILKNWESEKSDRKLNRKLIILTKKQENTALH